MFDSGITAKQIIDELKDEVDIAIPIPVASYLMWLNSLQQLIHTEVIEEQAEHGFIRLQESHFKDVEILDMPEPQIGANNIRYEDIHAVYADDTQLIESTVASGRIFPDTYWKEGNSLCVNLGSPAAEIRIVYFIKPELIDESNYNIKNVMVPIEFIEVVKAKLRGEAYKLANEDALSAKWLNDYNILLETLRAWVTNKKANFGL